MVFPIIYDRKLLFLPHENELRRLSGPPSAIVVCHLTTTSLPLITFWAYWPLCQPYEFTNSFLELPRPIYFFFTSYFHGFTTSFIGLPRPICFFFATHYFCGSADHYSCHSGLLVFALLFALPIFFVLLGFFCHWVFCQKWASTFSPLSNLRQ